jgi:rhodanese-related sulfurtransferase
MSTVQRYQRYLGAAALALGALAIVAGSPRVQGNARVDVAGLARTVEREDDHVTALELAEWIRVKRPNLRVVDVRDSSAFETYHIPRAERIALSGLVSTPFKKDETIVLYSDGGAHAAQGWVFLRAMGHERVYFLRGGLYEWLDDVMNPTISSSASESARTSFAKVAEISRYFGGVPKSKAEVFGAPPPAPAGNAERQSGQARSEHEHAQSRAAVARLRGRGC